MWVQFLFNAKQLTNAIVIGTASVKRPSQWIKSLGEWDMDKQRKLLNTVSSLIDAGALKTTLGENLGHINAENLKLAHAKLEEGKTIGKLVLEGFSLFLDS